jgi:hypothetical protein
MLSGNTYSPATSVADGVAPANNLRNAIIASNADTGTQTDTINLTSGTYSLDLSNVEVDATAHTLIIDGQGSSGPGATIIDQTYADRVFLIDPGATVVFENLEITGGNTTRGVNGVDTESDGGGILNQGTLTLTNVEVTGNTASAPFGLSGYSAYGGGIYSTGSLTINGDSMGDSSIFDNTATGTAGATGGGIGGNAYGGGIYSTGALTIGGCAITDNTAQGGAGTAGATADDGAGGSAYGGGLYSSTSDPVSITTTSFDVTNKAVGGAGGTGALRYGGNGGSALGGGAYIVNTGTTSPVLSGDDAEDDVATGGAGGASPVGGDGGYAAGGGIYVAGGPVTISNSLVSANTATGGQGGQGAGSAVTGTGGDAIGGGIEEQAGGSQLLNDTVWGNTATGGGSGTPAPGVGGTTGNAYGGGVDDDTSGLAIGSGLTLVNCTVGANSVAVTPLQTGGTAGTATGGGINNRNSGDVGLVVNNTIDATNTNGSADDDFDGPAASVDDNFIGWNNGGASVTGAGSTVGPHTSEPYDPAFVAGGPVYNGGYGDTVALQSTSGALGAGDPSAAIAAGLTTDQRGTGFARIVGGKVDMGAFETAAAATSTAIVASPNPATYGQNVTFTAIFSPAGGASGTPTGGVQFYDGATPIGPAQALTLVGGVYEATYSNSTLTVSGSPHSITAVYSGDSNFATSTSAAVSEVVNKAPTTTSLTVSPNPAAVGQSVTFTAIVTPANGTSVVPTSTVEFEDGATVLAAAQALTLVGGVYEATYSTSSLSLAGSPHSITATYAGDSNFTTSTSPAVSEVINSAPSSASEYVPLTYNLTGITTGGSHFSGSGGLDGRGNALSESLVSNSIAWNGLTFPIGPANAPDVVQATGQIITVPAGNYSSLAVLATGTNGNQSSLQFLITYSDSSTVTDTQSISDWAVGTAGATLAGNANQSVALSTPSHNTSSGGTNNSAGPFEVYGYSLAADSTKTIASITLPNDPHVKILSMFAVDPVAAPTALAAVDDATAPTTRADLSWTADSGATGYNVYRGTSAGGETSVPINSSPLAATANSYADATGLPGNTYFYTVKAIYGPTVSTPSNEASVTLATSGSTSPASTAASIPASTALASKSIQNQATDAALSDLNLGDLYA